MPLIDVEANLNDQQLGDLISYEPQYAKVLSTLVIAISLDTLIHTVSHVLNLDKP